MAATEQNLDIFMKRVLAAETRIDALTNRATGGIRAANLAASEMFGREQRFLVPKPLSIFTSPERGRAFKSFLTSLLVDSDGTVREYETLLQRRKGDQFHAWLRVAPVRNPK